MPTPKEIHSKIQEISNKHRSGKPPIAVNSIAEELGVNKTDLSQHIGTLKTLNFIDFTDKTNETIVLTSTGKYANLYI